MCLCVLFRGMRLIQFERLMEIIAPFFKIIHVCPHTHNIQKPFLQVQVKNPPVICHEGGNFFYNIIWSFMRYNFHFFFVCVFYPIEQASFLQGTLKNNNKKIFFITPSDVCIQGRDLWEIFEYLPIESLEAAMIYCEKAAFNILPPHFPPEQKRSYTHVLFISFRPRHYLHILHTNIQSWIFREQNSAQWKALQPPTQNVNINKQMYSIILKICGLYSFHSSMPHPIHTHTCNQILYLPHDFLNIN